MGLLVAAAALLGVAACDAPQRQGGLDPELFFPGSAVEIDILGEQVLRALVRSDTTSLERFRLTEHEHNGVIWPELPASAPEVNYPIDLGWQNIQNRNDRGLRRILPIYEGRDIGYRDVECRGETEWFETFHVLTDCWVVFTVAGRPTVFEAQIFKDVLVRGGGHKIFRYYDEEPRIYRGGSAE